MAVNFIGGGKKPDYLVKTTDLPQVAEKVKSHNVVLSTHCQEQDSNLQL